ncbi:phosphoglycerate kinase [candidate division KSB1 bacterium]
MEAVKKLTIDDIDVKGKCVLVRVDFNVPLDKNGRITDDSRIHAALSTIRKIIKDGGRAILMSHLGRPDGQVVDSMRLTPAANRLSEILGQPVIMAPDCIGPEVEHLINSMKNGECMVLENLRFHKEETDNDPEFAKKLSALGDIYVNDAFGTAHRAHASTEGITRYFDIAASGYLLQKEITYLANVMADPARPFIAVIGGAKISGKIDVIANLLKRVDRLLIGGGMMFTFLKAQGFEIGNSLLEEDRIKMAREILRLSENKLSLPVDCIVAESFDPGADVRTVAVEEIPIEWYGMDIGPETVRKYYKYIIEAKTIIWNGPMGVFEMDPFARGTFEIAQAISDSTEAGAVSVIGGGDSASAVKKANLDAKMTHISTGGGASLEMLEGKVLPGLAALTDKK